MSACLAVSKDLLTLPFSLLLSLCMPLFSGNVGSKPPASKSMPVCAFPSLLALPTGAFGVPQPNKLFPRWMDVSPPEKETKHSWERRQIIAYKHYLCSWGQSFCRQGFQISPSSSPLPLHFSLQWVTCPSSFPRFLYFHGPSVETPPAVPLLPLPPTPPSPHTHGSLMEEKPGQRSHYQKQLCLQRHPYISAPGSFGQLSTAGSPAQLYDFSY